MRWCSWTPEPGGSGRLGALRQRDGEEWLLDVASWAASREATAPADLVDLLEASELIQQRTTDLALTAHDDSPGWLRPASVRLLAPLRAPNSFRGFRAYRDDLLPVHYTGNRRAVAGDGEDVRWPANTEQLDYECQVAAVLGRTGRDLGLAEARAAIFGYVIVNDWTARDVERDELTYGLGPSKAKDFATSFGPVLVTADEWDPDVDHAMTVAVDDDVWSRGTTAGRRWTFADLVVQASRHADVYPTDVLASGTFDGGCGFDLNLWLAPSRLFTLYVRGIRTLTSRLLT